MSGYATGGKLACQTAKSTRIHLGTTAAHMRNAWITAQTQANRNANGLIIQPHDDDDDDYYYYYYEIPEGE